MWLEQPTYWLPDGTQLHGLLWRRDRDELIYCLGSVIPSWLIEE